MERVSIACHSCERLWTVGCALSLYERQILESRPCPHCGAYTLSVEELLGTSTAATPITWQRYAEYA
ncbi:MAG: hypothetical protein NZO58_07095 [Gemmataceae bacterium]|nr:hypothetical protein [Gemmataceae bacterium]